MNEQEKLALDLFIESVMTPDSELRVLAHEQGCFDELMEVRENVLTFLYRCQAENKSPYA
jgi:hypothetical protein